VVVGVMSGLNLEFNLFSSEGVPLQAKASVTIKEQKPEFDAKLLPPGSNTGAAATDALGAGGGAPGPGTAPAPDRTGTALPRRASPAPGPRARAWPAGPCPLRPKPSARRRSRHREG